MSFVRNCRLFCSQQSFLFGQRFSSNAAAVPLSLERLSGENKGIAVVHLHRPETKNAISKVFMETFTKIMHDIKFDKQSRVLILKSDVPGAFCAGADLKERRTIPVDEVPKWSDAIRQLTNDLSSMPIPVIAAIDGFALGGGLEIALACDIRIASENAKLGLVETRIAIIPGAGGTQRLSRLVGSAMAKEMIFTSKILNGTEAKNIGLVNHVVADPYVKATEIAKDILKMGPIAVKVAKIAVDRGMEVDLASGLAIEQQCYAQTVPTKDRLEGLAAFAEKRTPKYKGE